MTFARIVDTILATGKGVRGECVELIQYTDGGYGIAVNGEMTGQYFDPKELDSAVDAYARLIQPNSGDQLQ